MSMPPLEPAAEGGRKPPRRRTATLRPPRRERRERSVRLVECAPFPRASSEQRWCFGVTRDLSRSGLGVRLGRAMQVGSLVRVRVRSVEGHVSLDGLARVIWCRAGGEGGTALGLSVLADSSDLPRRAPALRRRPAAVARCA